MTPYYLALTLLTDATFGRGDGIAGLVDVEVEHDTHGLPYLRGRTLKGLWREECENLIAVHPHGTDWKKHADDLFGVGGSGLDSTGLLHVGDACLPAAVRNAVMQATLNPHDVLTSLTTIRRQTALDNTGVAQDHSLRSMRAILRTSTFISTITTTTDADLSSKQKAVLVAGCYALRRVGTGRNRGRGEVRCRLHDAAGAVLSADLLEQFVGERV